MRSLTVIFDDETERALAGLTAFADAESERVYPPDGFAVTEGTAGLTAPMKDPGVVEGSDAIQDPAATDDLGHIDGADVLGGWGDGGTECSAGIRNVVAPEGSPGSNVAGATDTGSAPSTQSSCTRV